MYYEDMLPCLQVYTYCWLSLPSNHFVIFFISAFDLFGINLGFLIGTHLSLQFWKLLSLSLHLPIFTLSGNSTFMLDHANVSSLIIKGKRLSLHYILGINIYLLVISSHFSYIWILSSLTIQKFFLGFW